MIKLTSCLALLGYASAIQIEQSAKDKEFNDWCKNFNKTYATTTELAARKANWLSTDASRAIVNAKRSNTFTVGPNRFDDWTQAEWLAFLGNVDSDPIPTLVLPTVVLPQTAPSSHGEAFLSESSTLAEVDTDFAKVVDWIKSSPAIVDQGNCGASWAFANSAAMEIQNAITNPKAGVRKFSEQLLLDCNTLNYGCGNGYSAAKLVSDWLVPGQIKVALASAYPWTGKKAACRTTVTRTTYFPIAQNNFSYVQSLGSSAAYLAALKKGPIVILIAGDSDHWKYYKSGVINDPDCFKSGKLNHAVVIVGHSYDEDFNLAYWIVRNSWGTSWGELGYAKIAITDSGYGICGDSIKGWNIDMKAFL